MSYQVHNFQPGDVLLASQLNEMDYQIALNESAIDNLSNLSDVAIINAWMQGGVDANGNDVNSEKYIRTDFLLLRKGEVYTLNIDDNYLCQIFYYNSTKGFIGFSEQFDGEKEINSLNNDVIQNGYIKLVLQAKDFSNIVPDDGNTNSLIAFRSVLISSVRQNSEAIRQNSEAISQNSEAIVVLGNDVADLKSAVANIDGLTPEIKSALMDVVEHIGAWSDGNAQTYIQNLHDALYPSEPPAAIVSIEAVFVQGSTVVYDTATLDSLKSMLTVTAIYDDDSTAIVSDYALSGTLTAGSSVITVSYQGKTDTFTVTVTESEPEPVSVEMMPLVQHVSMSYSSFYADGGTETYSDARFPTSNGVTKRSTKVFERDTRLKITCAPASNVFQCFLFTSSLWDGTTVLGPQDTTSFYYAESSNGTFPYGWSSESHEFYYTVRAGYAFVIIGISSSKDAVNACTIEEV